jgi:hypothetical protein
MRHRSLLVSALALALALAPSYAEQARTVERATSIAEAKGKLVTEGEDSFTYAFPGLAGYSVLWQGAHGRDWIDFVYDSEQTDLSDALRNAAGGQWTRKADDTLLWRGTMIDGNFVPYACILRMTATDDTDTAQDTLVIIQLNGASSQVVKALPATQGLDQARTTADQLCKFE